MTAESFPPADVKTLVAEISRILTARGETISVSEAACGGLLSAYLVSIPGASQFFQGGTLVYSLKSRLKLSGWDAKDIAEYTGPSEKVALRLARNLRIELGSTYVLSETGYAGPSTVIREYEESTTKPENKAGSVYIGIAGPNGSRSILKQTDSDNREENMQAFAKYGLEFLLEELEAAGDVADAVPEVRAETPLKRQKVSE